MRRVVNRWAAAAAALALLGVGRTAPAQTRDKGGLTLVQAARTTLLRQPRVLLQQQAFLASKGNLQAARGQFDLKVASSFDRRHDESPNTQADTFALKTDVTTTDVTTYKASLQKQFRNGLTLSPSAEVTRTELNVSPIVTNRTTVQLLAVQPLLRGAGPTAVAANERFSQHDVVASGLDLRFTEASSVLQTVIAYWNYVAAARRLEIAQDSEKRAQRILEETKILIQLDARPAADIKQAEANMSDRISSRIAAEQSVYQARQTLGLAMGLDFDTIQTLPLPADDFPEMPEGAAPPPPDPVLIDSALRLRSDLKSSTEREVQSEILSRAAGNALKPQLDLVLSGGFAGLAEGTGTGQYFSAFDKNLQGLNASVNVSFSWPFANRAAEGRYASSQASWEQARVRTADLERTIRSNVSVARDDLVRSAQRVRNSRKAADLFRSAIDDEREKHKLGLATIIDLINTEDRLDSSLQNEVAAAAAYAQAVARLRYETGTLLKAGAPGQAVDFNSLTTVPGPGATGGAGSSSGR